MIIRKVLKSLVLNDPLLQHKTFIFTTSAARHTEVNKIANKSIATGYMARAFCVALFRIVILMSATVEATVYPWLNDNDVQVINRTSTSVVLTWRLPTEMRPSEVRKYRLFVSYRRRGYSLRTIEALPSDPDCSLMLSYCHLRDLVPGQAYSATISIDYIRNETLLGRANLPFATRDPSKKDEEIMWWLLYVAVPAAVAVVLLVTIICIARCCRCWRKKKVSNKKTPKTGEEAGKKTGSSTASPESSGLDRKHSLQTRQWVKNTLECIDLDPETSTYDHPLVSSPTYDTPRDMNSPVSALAVSSSARSHFYMEFVDRPPSSASSDAPKKRSKSTSTMLGTKCKDKKLKKSRTNPSMHTVSAELPASVNNQEIREPPKPCKIKPPINLIHKSASLPSCQQQKQPLPSLRQETPPNTPLAELHQKLQGKLLQQQQLQAEGQTDLDTPLYANTEDLTKLKGNARKMFPML